MTTQAKEISRHERVKVVTRTTAAAAEQHDSPVVETRPVSRLGMLNPFMHVTAETVCLL